jgi:hypothetical protein
MSIKTKYANVKIEFAHGMENIIFSKIASH